MKDGIYDIVFTGPLRTDRVEGTFEDGCIRCAIGRVSVELHVPFDGTGVNGTARIDEKAPDDLKGYTVELYGVAGSANFALLGHGPRGLIDISGLWIGPLDDGEG